MPRNCPCSKLKCARSQTWTPTRVPQHGSSRCDTLSSAQVALLHLLHLHFSFLSFTDFFFSSSSFPFFFRKPLRLRRGWRRPPPSICQSASCRRGWGLTLCTSSQLRQPNKVPWRTRCTERRPPTTWAPLRLFTLTDPVIEGVGRFRVPLSSGCQHADVGSRFHTQEREERRRNALKYVDTVQNAKCRVFFFFHSATFRNKGMRWKTRSRVVQLSLNHYFIFYFYFFF